MTKKLEFFCFVFYFFNFIPVKKNQNKYRAVRIIVITMDLFFGERVTEQV